MSLVAYGSSGEESDSSDSEEVQSSRVSKEPMITNNDGQEDGEKLTSTGEGREEENKTGLVLPSPKQRNETSNSVKSKGSFSLSSFLPKPKNISNREKESTDTSDEKPSISSSAMMDDEEEILEIEEDYEPIVKRTKKIQSSQIEDKPKSVGSLFSLLPSPWQAENSWLKTANPKVKAKSKQATSEERGSKQHVKIAIPIAPKTDSDDEDDSPAAKKIIPSKEGSGLKSLLPKPKHSITMKADNPNKPSVKLASRPLIPHTLTKKAKAAEKMPQKTAKVLNQAEGAISDDEDEPVSFFTFSDKTESLTDEKAETIQSQDAKSNSGLKVNEPVQEISNHAVTSFLRGKVPSTSPTFQGAAGLTESKQQVVEVPSAQVDFGSEESFSSGELETKTYYYEQQPAQNQQYPGYSANDYQYYSYNTGNYGQESEAYTYTYPTGTPAQEQTQLQETNNIDLEKLHKLKGKRNRHEEINIVDVNADDQIGNSAEMVAKYGTEEVAHRPSRKKKDMPTAQQRRKHQITYLAYQAKEREFELRQQWSANRQTRRQTQSKYGF